MRMSEAAFAGALTHVDVWLRVYGPVGYGRRPKESDNNRVVQAST